jgi:hypothetical protein
MMTDMEKDIEERIKEWYQSIDDPFFQHKPWQHLFDEEKQMVAEMYWEDQLIKAEDEANEEVDVTIYDGDMAAEMHKLIDDIHAAVEISSTNQIRENL